MYFRRRLKCSLFRECVSMCIFLGKLMMMMMVIIKLSGEDHPNRNDQMNRIVYSFPNLCNPSVELSEDGIFSLTCVLI